MARNILAREVPALAAGHVEGLRSELRAREELQVDGVNGWILHAGGREVLAAVRTRLSLGGDELPMCTSVLRDFGNVSRPFVRFVLERAMAKNAPGFLLHRPTEPASATRRFGARVLRG